MAVEREAVNGCCNGYRGTVSNPMSNPQFLTFGEAERRFRIAKATLSRDRSKGRLSAERQEDGSYRVAVSELIRAYGDRLKPGTAATGDDNGDVERSSTPPLQPLQRVSFRPSSTVCAASWSRSGASATTCAAGWTVRTRNAARKTGY
jgi:hypothetical protein